MKYKIATCILFAIILCFIANTIDPVLADSPRRAPAAIVFGYDIELGPITQGPYGTYRPQVGLIVTWVSASEHCPQIPVGASVGSVLAALMQEGFHLEGDQLQKQYVLSRK